MRVLPYSELKDRGITHSREQLRRLVKQAKFPVPISLSDRRIGWVETEIEAWLEGKAALRPPQKAA